MLPPPSACGAPWQYRDWRPGQAEALTHIIDSPTRIRGLVLPTGAGKSLITTTLATLTGWRTAILTSTKGLQDQIGTAFHAVGLEDLRGQANYPCRALQVGGALEEYATDRSSRSCEAGPCKVGVACPWRDRGCGYYDAVRAATTTTVLVTNYQAWMAQYGYGDGLGDWDCLVCDEAHAAPEEVASFLASTLTSQQLRAVGLTPPDTEEMPAWSHWARAGRPRVQHQVEGLQARVKDGRTSEVAPLQLARTVLRLLDKLSTAAADQWVCTTRGSTTEFHPLDIGAQVERTLLHGIPRIVLTSATLTPKTVEALGLNPEAVSWYSAPSTFPVDRRPVIHVQTCRIDHRLDDAGTRLWLLRVDQILAGRADRKGIIHAGSYARAKLIYEHSTQAPRLLFHDRPGLQRQVERFRTSPAGTVLVSPSVTTGFDFPGPMCEFQIILKVPWPDAREPVMAARTRKDKDYPAYLAMQALVQAVGRGMRSESDRCEVLLLDDHVRWFLHKYRRFAPDWFLEAYRSQLTIPPPPPRL